MPRRITDRVGEISRGIGRALPGGRKRILNALTKRRGGVLGIPDQPQRLAPRLIEAALECGIFFIAFPDYPLLDTTNVPVEFIVVRPCRRR